MCNREINIYNFTHRILHFSEHCIAINIVTYANVFLSPREFHAVAGLTKYREREKIRAHTRLAVNICGAGEARFPSVCWQKPRFFNRRLCRFYSDAKAQACVATRPRRSIVSLRARAPLLPTGTGASRRPPTSRCQRPFIYTFHRRPSARFR